MNDSSALNTGPVQGTSTAGERLKRGRPSKAMSDHIKSVVKDMAAAECTPIEIADHLGVSRQAVSFCIARMNRPAKREQKSSRKSSKKLSKQDRLSDRLSLMRCRRFIALMCLGGLIDEECASEATGLPARMFRSMMTYVQEHMPDRSPAVK